MIIASNAFLELQHSFSTSPGMATGTLMLVRNRSRRSAFAIRINVDASKKIIMTKYDERNSSRKEMYIEEPKAFRTAKKIAAQAYRSNVQQLALALFCFARQPFGREPNARRCASC